MQLGDLAFQLLNQGVELGDLFRVLALLVLAEQEEIGFVLRTPAMEVELVILDDVGPQFLGLLISDGLLDDLCLTVAPLLVGGAAPRIATGLDHVRNSMRRSHLLTDDAGYLYMRYVRGG